MALLDPQASPSDLTESRVANRTRIRHIRLEFLGLPAVNSARRAYVQEDGRVISMRVWQRTAGAADSLDVDLHAKKGAAAEASILAAVPSIPQGDGNNQRVQANLAVDADGHGVALSGGDYIEAQIDVVQGAGAADVVVDIEYLRG